MASSSPPGKTKSYMEVGSPDSTGDGLGLFAGLSLNPSSRKDSSTSLSSASLEDGVTPKVKNYSKIVEVMGNDGPQMPLPVDGSTTSTSGEHGKNVASTTTAPTTSGTGASSSGAATGNVTKGEKGSSSTSSAGTAELSSSATASTAAAGAAGAPVTSVTDKLLGLLGSDEPTRTTAAVASSAAVEGATSTTSNVQLKPKAGPPSLNTSTGFISGPKSPPKTNGKNQRIKPQTPTNTPQRRPSSSSRMVIHPQTNVRNVDVLMRLLRKFAYRTQPKIFVTYGGTKSLGVLRYFLGSPKETDPNFVPYRHLIDIILNNEDDNNNNDDDDGSHHGRATSPSAGQAQTTQTIESILGQPGDTIERARTAVSSFCHLLSVWGHASSRFFEQEDYKSQQSFSELLCASFDTASELISHGCLDGVRVRISTSPITSKTKSQQPNDAAAAVSDTPTDDDDYTSIVNLIAESVIVADLSIGKNELAAMKFLLSAGCRVISPGEEAQLRGTHLLQSIRMLYHIYLTTETEAHKTTARAALQQVVTNVFARLVRTKPHLHSAAANTNDSKAMNNQKSFDKTFPSENHRDAFLVLRSICKLSMRTLPDPNMHSHIGYQTSGSNIAWDGANNGSSRNPDPDTIQPGTAPSSPSRKPGQGAAVVSSPNSFNESDLGAGENPQTPTAISSPVHEPMPKEHAHLIYTNAIHSALESKLLALEILHYVLENVQFTKDFVQTCGYQFHTAIRNYLCVSLLKNCTSDNTAIVNLSLRMFVPLIRNFRSILKNEIEAFVTNVFFVILDSKNSPVEHKSLVVTLFEEICSDTSTLAEIFLNYDCDLSAVDLFHRIVNTLSKVAQSSELALSSTTKSSFTFTAVAGAGAVREEKMRNEQRELRLDAMKALRQVLASLQTSMVEPLVLNNMNSSEHHEQSQLASSIRSTADSVQTSGSTDELGDSTNPLSQENGEKANKNASKSTNLVHIYDSKKKRREEESEVVLRFNQKPASGISFAAKCGHINGEDPVDVAAFLHKNKDILEKTQIGEYLGREPEYQKGFALKVLNEYVRYMDFTNLTFDDAIRFYLSGFRLPGEAQKIDRIMEKFAERYTLQNPDVFPSADVAFILAFSIIMLNTDLHNPAIKEERRMTRQGFVRNNRGICDGQDLPEDLLTSIFDRIKSNPISLKEDDDARERSGDATAASSTTLPAGLNPASFFTSHYDEMDRTRETNFQKERDHIVRTTESLLKRRRQPQPHQKEKDKDEEKNDTPNRDLARQRSSSVKHSKFHRSKFVRTEDSGLRDEYVSPMFEVTWGPCLAAFSTAMESANGTLGALAAIATDEELELAAENAAETIEVCLTGFRFAICTAGLCGNEIARDAFMLALSRFSQLGTGVLLEPRHVRCIQTMLGLGRDDGELLGSSWEHIFKALSEVNRFHQLFHLMARNDRTAAHATERRRRRLEELEKKRQHKQHEADDAASSDEVSVDSSKDLSAYSSDYSDTDDSDIFSTEDDFDFEDEMDKKAIDEANARVVYEAVSEALIEAIYERSSSLSHRAVKEFVLQLCRVSRMEISVKGYGGHAGNFANTVDLTKVQYRHSHELLLHNVDSEDKDHNQQFHHSQPNIYNLQKLVEVTHYNMESRPRLIFGEIWNLVSGHLTSTALHSNPAVAMYAVDSFRQLSIQYLERQESEVFEFQRRFLKPLETVITRAEHVSTKELLLKCVERIILMFGSSDVLIDSEGSERGQGRRQSGIKRKGNLRSGWVSLLHVLGAAGKDADDGIAEMGYNMLKGQLQQCLEFDQEDVENPNALLSEHFVDVVNATLEFVVGGHEELSLKAIDDLVALSGYLANESVPAPASSKRRSRSSSNASSGNVDPNEGKFGAINKQDLELWWPILLGLSRSIGDSRPEVRSKGLASLFKIINQYYFPDAEGNPDESISSTALQTLRLIFRGILTPVLEFAETEAPDGQVPSLPEDFERFLTLPAVVEESEDENRRRALSADTSSWLEATFEEFMDGCVDICLSSLKKYKDDALLEEIFAILNSCLQSDSGALAVRGLRRLEVFVTSDIDAEFITDDTWATVSHMMRRCLCVRGLPETQDDVSCSASVSVASSSVDGFISGEDGDKSNSGEDQAEIIDQTENAEEAIKEFILEDRVLRDRRYVGSNATMVIGSLLGSERFLEMIGLRWRLFMVTGLGQAIRDWEHASSILASKNNSIPFTNSNNSPAPDYLENVIYARKWMNRFILQLASIAEVARLPDKNKDPRASRFAAAQQIVLNQTQYLLTSFVEKEIDVSRTQGNENAVALYKRMSNLVAELLAGYSNMEPSHLKHMSWLGPVLLGSCIQSNNESVRLAVQKLVHATSPGTNAAAYPPPDISSPVLNAKSTSKLGDQDIASNVVPDLSGGSAHEASNTAAPKDSSVSPAVLTKKIQAEKGEEKIEKQKSETPAATSLSAKQAEEPVSNGER